MVQEFENVASSDTRKDHLQEHGLQVSFKPDLQLVISTFEDVGNPLTEGEDLIVLDTKDIMSTAVIQMVKDVIMIGQGQYDSYMHMRFIERLKQKAEIAKLNNYCSLFFI